MIEQAFLGLWKFLNENEVKYLVTGEVASKLHGVSYGKDEISIWIENDPVNQEKIRLALSKLDNTIDFPIPMADEVSLEVNTIGAVTVRTRVAGLENVSFESCHSLASIAAWENIQMPFLHIDHLILEKRKSGGNKMRLDISELDQIKQARKSVE